MSTTAEQKEEDAAVVVECPICYLAPTHGVEWKTCMNRGKKHSVCIKCFGQLQVENQCPYCKEPFDPPSVDQARERLEKAVAARPMDDQRIRGAFYRLQEAGGHIDHGTTWVELAEQNSLLFKEFFGCMVTHPPPGLKHSEEFDRILKHIILRSEEWVIEWIAREYLDKTVEMAWSPSALFFATLFGHRDMERIFKVLPAFYGPGGFKVENPDKIAICNSVSFSTTWEQLKFTLDWFHLRLDAQDVVALAKDDGVFRFHESVIGALADLDAELVNQQTLKFPGLASKLPFVVLDKIVNRPTGRLRLPFLCSFETDQFTSTAVLRAKYRLNMDTLVVSLADGSCEFKPFHAWNDPDFKGNAPPPIGSFNSSFVIDVIFRDPKCVDGSTFQKWMTPQVAIGENFILVYNKRTTKWAPYVTPFSALDVHCNSITVAEKLTHGVFIQNVFLKINA